MSERAHACGLCAPNRGWLPATVRGTGEIMPIVCPLCHGEGNGGRPIHRAATETATLDVLLDAVPYLADESKRLLRDRIDALLGETRYSEAEVRDLVIAGVAGAGARLGNAALEDAVQIGMEAARRFRANRGEQHG